MDPKKVAKGMSKKFACSCAFSNKSAIPEISIQGDVEYDLPDYLVELGVGICLGCHAVSIRAV